MQIIQFVPGHIVSPAAITLPVTAPDIDVVVDAEIERLPSALSPHAAGAAPVVHAPTLVDVVHAGAAVADHLDHNHDLAVGGAAMVVPCGASAGGNDIVDGAGALIPGGGATGVQDQALSAHGVTQPNDHVAAAIVASVDDHPAVDIANGLADHVGTDPVVPGAPYDVTRLSTRTFSLNVDTELGDLLTLAYLEVGERVLVS
jgi:hypothetical protein